MSSVKPVRRLLQFATILIPFVLILAACTPAAGPPATPNTPPVGAPGAAPTYTASGPNIDRIKNARKVNVLVDTSLPPWVYLDQNGQIVGADVEIATAFAKDLGVSLNLVPTHWATIFDDLNSGRGDAIISEVLITQERQNYVLFSTPYYTAGQVIIVRQDNDSITGPNDLAGKVVGVIANSVGLTYAQGISGVKEIKQYPTGTGALDALGAGEVDAAINSLPISQYYINSHPTVKLACTQPLTVEDIGIALGSNSPDLQAFANQFIDNIKSDGRLDQILSKYGLK